MPSSTSHKSKDGGASEQCILEKLLPRIMRLEGRVQCVQINAKRIVKSLGEISTAVPLTFVKTFPLSWQTAPSEVTLGTCAPTTDSESDRKFSNFVTVEVNLIRSVAEDDSSSSSDSTSEENEAKNPAPRRSHRRQGTEQKSLGENGDLASLYKQLGIKSKSASKKGSKSHEKKSKRKTKLAGGGKCHDCPKPTPAPDCSSTTSSSSSEEDCPTVKKCVSIKCCPVPTPVVRPTALKFSFFFSPLQGTIRGCNQVLVHHFTPETLKAIEDGISDKLGLKLNGSLRHLLRRIPAIGSNNFSGTNVGFPTTLGANLELNKHRIIIGSPTRNTVHSAPQALFGPENDGRSVRRSLPSRLTVNPLFGFNRGTFSSGFVTIQFIVDLAAIESLLSGAGSTGLAGTDEST
jgi:hypothetical protein